MEKAKPNKIHTHEEEDRISQLPEEILHRILDFSDTKAAAKTCVLSKSWRYVWCTNPILKFPDPYLAGNFPLDRILQSYHDRNLCLDEFSLTMVMGKDEALLLNKWISMIIQDMCVKTFHLTVNYGKAGSLELPSPLQLPSLILESDHIQKLSILQGLVGLIMLESSSTTQPRVHLKHLQTLLLDQVYIPQHILDSILSNCLLLERVSLLYCEGFTRIKLLTNLTAFSFRRFNNDLDVSIEIGDHIPTLETMELEGCLLSVSRNKPLEFVRLKRLSLSRVQLSWESFSCNLHSLEELKLDQCFGIKELKLSSRSMKFLDINNISRPFRVAVDAPSIVSFNYEGILPQSISFATTSSSDDLWKSEIYLESMSFNDDDDDEPSHCFNELYGLLNALSQSKIITLIVEPIEIRRWFWTQLHSINVGVSEEAKQLPVVVENLRIEGLDSKMHSSAAPFLNMLCHMFRPSFVLMYDENYEIAESLFKEREMGKSYFWPRDLEGASLQVKYRNQSEWQPVEYTSFTELRKKGAVRNFELRIQLTWRD